MMNIASEVKVRNRNAKMPIPILINTGTGLFAASDECFQFQLVSVCAERITV